MVLFYIIMGTAEFGQQSADFIKEVFSMRYGSDLECTEILGNNVTLANVRAALHAVNTYLSSPGRQAIVYYNGHGDQIPDHSGDEPDGKDEVWRLMGGGIMVDDEISLIFSGINEQSYLWLISDSCSSGTIIDRQLNNHPWMCLTSCNAWQDSVASIDGGMFTLFGLLPAIQCCNTLREIYQYICSVLDIPTQTPEAEVTRDSLWDIPLFPKTTISVTPMRLLLSQLLPFQWMTPLYRLSRPTQDTVLKTLDLSDTAVQIYRDVGVRNEWLHPTTYAPMCPYSSEQAETLLRLI